MIDRLVSRCRRSVVIAACLAALTACSDTAAPLSRLGEDAVILAFGDSLTYGTGAGKDDSYPARLADLSGLTVINAGKPGELSAAGRQRLPALLDRHRPDLLILCHAGNDMLRKQELDRAAGNLQAMIRIARDSGSDVLLLAVPAPALFPGDAPFYREVATATGTPLLADALADILSTPNLKADAVHPNKAGYDRLAHTILDKLQNIGALPAN